MTRRGHAESGRGGSANGSEREPWAPRPVRRFDEWIEGSVAPFRGRRSLDRSFYALSEAANHSILWHGINLVDAAVGGPLHRRRALRRSVILGIEQTLVNGVVKTLFRRDRPEPLEHSPHRLRTPRTSSFPSGHASAGACAATLLSRDMGAAPLWWTTAGVVSASRVYVGVHHPSDVLGGLVIGRLLARIAERFWPTPEAPHPQPPTGTAGAPSRMPNS